VRANLSNVINAPNRTNADIERKERAPCDRNTGQQRNHKENSATQQSKNAGNDLDE